MSGQKVVIFSGTGSWSLDCTFELQKKGYNVIANGYSMRHATELMPYLFEQTVPFAIVCSEGLPDAQKIVSKLRDELPWIKILEVTGINNDCELEKIQIEIKTDIVCLPETNVPLASKKELHRAENRLIKRLNKIQNTKPP